VLFKNFEIFLERIRWMKLSLTPKIIILGEEENYLFVNYMLILAKILIFKVNDNRDLNFIRFIRFVDEKFKTEKEAANITRKWGCFLQKWEKYIEYK
jgi:hypothetical protein